jgi:hypothetical protein
MDMAKKTVNQSRRAGWSAAKRTAGRTDAARKAAKGEPSDDDMVADIVLLRGLVQRLGAERVIRLVKHFE